MVYDIVNSTILIIQTNVIRSHVDLLENLVIGDAVVVLCCLLGWNMY